MERTIETLLYRTVFIPEDDDPNPLFVLPTTGRWPTGWTLYTTTSVVIAWAEYCRNHPRDVAASDLTGGVGVDEASLDLFARLELAGVLAARSLYSLTFGFDRLADLTSPWAEECLRRAGFDLTSFHAEPSAGYGDCPELASLTDTLGWEAMRVPSAAWRRGDGWCVPVFRAGRARLLSAHRLLERASPTVAVAVATRYAAGERPAWLGPAA